MNELSKKLAMRQQEKEIKLKLKLNKMNITWAGTNNDDQPKNRTDKGVENHKEKDKEQNRPKDDDINNKWYENIETNHPWGDQQQPGLGRKDWGRESQPARGSLASGKWSVDLRAPCSWWWVPILGRQTRIWCFDMMYSYMCRVLNYVQITYPINHYRSDNSCASFSMSSNSIHAVGGDSHNSVVVSTATTTPSV
jgi:hypothetical protein